MMDCYDDDAVDSAVILIIIGIVAEIPILGYWSKYHTSGSIIAAGIVALFIVGVLINLFMRLKATSKEEELDSQLVHASECRDYALRKQECDISKIARKINRAARQGEECINCDLYAHQIQLLESEGYKVTKRNGCVWDYVVSWRQTNDH